MTFFKSKLKAASN